MGLVTNLPPSARTVHRSVVMPPGNGTTSLYTVPAGSTLYIINAYVIGPGGDGIAGIGCLSEDNLASANPVLVFSAVGVTKQVNSYLRGAVIRVPSGSVDATTLITTVPWTIGFSGFVDGWHH